MYEGEPSGSGTAFRTAEKKYQLHKEQQFANRKGARRAKGLTVRPVDFSGVLDLQPDARHPGIACLGVPSGMPPAASAYSFAAHPGLLLVRGALPPDMQRQLVLDALTRYPEPPNHTNHLKAYPGGLPGLWDAAQQGLLLQHAAQLQQQPAGVGAAVAAHAGGSEAGPAAGPHLPAAVGSSSEELWGVEGSGPTAASLLRHLRWATLGPPYDWTQRVYLRDVLHMPLLPALLHQLAVKLADLAGQLLEGGDGSTSSDSSSSSSGGGGSSSRSRDQQAYCPDAALLNYYHEGDTLNGHLDDAERCLGHPLVSLSLGCDAIFLMGTASKDDPPTALLLRSGDALVLSGPARRCYHGLPRILTGAERPGAEALRGTDCNSSGGDGDSRDGSRDGGSGIGGNAVQDSDPFHPFARHMQDCRINISIRDTH